MVVVILGSSLVGFFLNERRKDPCLKHFQDYLTTVHLKNGKKIWGRLDVQTSGVEFRYQGNYWDQDHVETSFILFKEEFNSIYAFFRFHSQLSPKASSGASMRSTVSTTLLPPSGSCGTREISSIPSKTP
jgi:hypothetical protein